MFFGKMLERIVHSDLLEYFLRNNLLSPYQYGFLPNRSTQEAVFELTKTMYNTINNRKVMGLIYLDVAKAFNCIHHTRLFNKLHGIGCSNHVVSWMQSYLNRSQRVRLYNIMSDVIGVSAGIAQGTVLGPLIFIFYINVVIHSMTQCRISMFADDCIIYTVANDFEPMHRKLQLDLDSFIMWCPQNGLKIHISKTKAMITTTNSRLRTLQNVCKFKIGDQLIQYVNQYNYLGLLLDNELTLIPLLKHVKKKVNYKLFALWKLRKYLTNQAAVLMYK